MRAKEPKIVVTFVNTTDAMKMEAVCEERKVPGRMIPVPKVISAGCGLAWCSAPENEDVIREVLKFAGLKEQAIHYCLI
ncbi:MAG: DUF3343 domain-containing protein [Catonella sp.]